MNRFKLSALAIALVVGFTSLPQAAFAAKKGAPLSFKEQQELKEKEEKKKNKNRSFKDAKKEKKKKAPAPVRSGRKKKKGKKKSVPPEQRTPPGEIIE
jgi:hypothetical protein